MDLDNIKNIWSEETISETPEISLQKQKEIHFPLEKIRKNMQMEFWMTVISIILMLIWSIFSIENHKAKLYVTMLIISMLLVIIFYFNIFFKTYKTITNNALSSLDSLKHLLFQLKLNEQYYISYYLAFVPFLLCEMIVLYEFMPVFRGINTSLLVFVFGMSLLFGLLFLYYFGKYWFNDFYGKYINKVSELIYEVSDEEKIESFGSNLFKSTRKNTYFSRTESFFTNKLGSIGQWINILFWMIISILILLILSFVVGFLIGYLSVYLKL